MLWTGGWEPIELWAPCEQCGKEVSSEETWDTCIGVVCNDCYLEPGMRERLMRMVTG